MTKGDLVYVPSQVNLLKFDNKTDYGQDPSFGGIIEYITLSTPKNLLLLEEELMFKRYFKVWYDGSEWYVARESVKEVLW